mgnify:CR=1 FL=1
MRDSLYVLRNLPTRKMRDFWEEFRAVTLVYVLVVLVMCKIADDQDKLRGFNSELSFKEKLYLLLLLVFSYCSMMWPVYDKHW